MVPDRNKKYTIRISMAEILYKTYSPLQKLRKRKSQIKLKIKDNKI